MTASARPFRVPDGAMAPFPRRGRHFDQIETETIRTLALGGQSGATIVEKLATAGFVRSERSVVSSMAFLLGRRERRAARMEEAAARSEVTDGRVSYDHRRRGVRREEFPGVTLPRVSIQAGSVAHPEPWAS